MKKLAITVGMVLALVAALFGSHALSPLDPAAGHMAAPRLACGGEVYLPPCE